MASVSELQYFLYLTLITVLLPTPLPVSSTSNMSLPGCPDKCGNITIPYPFGTREGCYRPGFRITCDETTNPPVARTGNIKLIDINITSGEARFYKTIGYACFDNSTGQERSNNPLILINSTKTYLFSNSRNKFTVIGCSTMALMVVEGANSSLSGCMSFCASLNSASKDGSCNGLGCCQTAIPTGLNYYNTTWALNGSITSDFNPCSYAVLVEEDWYKFQVEDLHGSEFYDRNPEGVPLVLDWAIRENGTCLESHVENSTNPACQSNHSRCDNTTNGDGYLCKCLDGYEGNPYIPDGCKDIDECNPPNENVCHGICTNTEGNYTCSCPKWTNGDAKAGNCTEIIPKPARVAIASILAICILLALCFLVASYLQHRKRIKEKEEYQRYYQTMENFHLRVLSKKQIEIATNNFDESKILGSGGQGNVYKGYLEDNKPVAIKRSREVEGNKREEFVNEIILLSQINHKNIVKLLGCCLEVKIPMLVYEFIPSGTLYDFLHGRNQKRSIPLGTRLNIALESAEALDYLHSSISRSILHGDVKSANILLEDNYRAKVSDFGASNLVPIDDTQIIKVIQGTRGYLDPEYVATGVLTKKSDVYSFGVVLLELITRKYAIFTGETHEKKHLASCFVSDASKNKLHQLLDKEIVSANEKVIEVLHEVSKLAVWCLNVKGEDRPTMKQVVEKLLNLVKLHGSLLGLQNVPEETKSLFGESTSYTATDSSAFHSTGYSSLLGIDTRLPR